MFYVGHPFELPLLIQSFVMIIGMLAMMEICVRVKKKNLYYIASIDPISHSGRHRRRTTSLMGKLTNHDTQLPYEEICNESQPIYSVTYSHVNRDDNLGQQNEQNVTIDRNNVIDSSSQLYQNHQPIEYNLPSIDSIPNAYSLDNQEDLSVSAAVSTSLPDRIDNFSRNESHILANEISTTRTEGTKSCLVTYLNDLLNVDNF